MSVGVGEVLTLLQGIRLAVDLWRDISNAPKEVMQLKKELIELTKPLESLLLHFQAQAGSRSDAALKKVQDPDRRALADTIRESLQDCGEIQAVFDKFATKRLAQVGDVALVARFEFVANAAYKLFDGSEKVKALTLRIRERQASIQTYLQIIQVKLLDDANTNIKNLGDKIDRLRRDAEKKTVADKAMSLDMVEQIKKLLVKELAEAKKSEIRGTSNPGRPLVAPNSSKSSINLDNKSKPARAKTPDPSGSKNNDNLLVPMNSDKNHKRRLSAPSVPVIPRLPSPKPTEKSYSILFVDPYNGGRSVVSQVMLLLINSWLRAAVPRDGNEYVNRFKRVSSAGFFVTQDGDCLDEIKRLDYSQKSYNLGLKHAEKGRDADGLRALFAETTTTAAMGQDTEWRNGGGSRAKYQELFRETLPKGIQRAQFYEYDFILCFTAREYSNLHRLRSAIITKDDSGTVPGDKAKILNLGRWLGKDVKGNDKEILFVPRSNQGDDIAAWNVRIDEMKTAIDGFLQKRLKIKYPEKPVTAAAKGK